MSEHEKRHLEEESNIEVALKIREAFEGQKIEFVGAETLLKDTTESCVDGRIEDGIIGTPGGNAGEFLLLLKAYLGEDEDISDEQVEEYLNNFIQENGKFYMHTDSHALEYLKINEHELLNPNNDKKDEYLEKLTEPGEVGCGHLNLALQFPDEYGVGEELTKKVIRAVYKKMWEEGGSDDIEFVVLQGGHTEKAVVNMVIKDKSGNEIHVEDNTSVPKISPKVGETAFFINHPQVVAYLREEMVKTAGKVFGDDDVKAENILNKINALADEQMAQTLGRLAKGKPILNAVFEVGEDGEVKFKKIESDGNSVQGV